MFYGTERCIRGSIASVLVIECVIQSRNDPKRKKNKANFIVPESINIRFHTYFCLFPHNIGIRIFVYEVSLSDLVCRGISNHFAHIGEEKKHE
jgi:hypothetical protein